MFFGECKLFFGVEQQILFVSGHLALCYALLFIYLFNGSVFIKSNMKNILSVCQGSRTREKQVIRVIISIF